MTRRPVRRTTRGLVARAAVAALLATGLAGCKFDGAYDLPLPGSPVDEDEAYQVTAEFDDVLNVVPRSPVYVSDVTVGEVTDVVRKGWHAQVTLLIREDVKLPDNAVAEIRQTSLLGEKYVDLAPPQNPRGRLGEGDRIPLSATGRNPEVEEVLGALSFLLSGGGIGQIKTITTELNNVMNGRTDQLRNLLGELESLVGTLDDQKQDIITAMEAINKLTATLNRERGTIEAALDAAGPALQILREQHGQLMTMLRKLDELGVVGTRVINGSKENMIKDLQHLKPILKQLNAAGDSLPRGMSMMISFPFPQEAADIAFGDYANAEFAMDIDLTKATVGPPLPELPLPDLPLAELKKLCEATPARPGCDKILNSDNGGTLPGVPGTTLPQVSQSSYGTGSSTQGGLFSRGFG